MYFRLYLLSFLLITPFAFANPLNNSNSISQFNDAFAKNVVSQLTQKSIPGGAYVIVKNNKVLALKTFGYTDKKKSQKITHDTVFRLASVSKTFAATLTTMLAQEERLKLTDPITQYVPQFSLATKGAAEKIQLQHLLSHSSGLMPNAYDNLLHENWNMEKIIGRFDRVSPICRPAQCYGYQNIAYALLEPAIEASQPKSYTKLMHDRIFSPLKMTNASVGLSPFLAAKNSAQPHVLRKRINTGKKDANGKDIKRYIWRTVKVQPDFYKVAPAAGVNASISDLAKWLIANLGHQPRILSPNLLTELTTPRIKTKKDLRRRYWREHLTDAHYGYGWRLYQFDDFPIIYHSGWVEGFRADIGYSPDLDIGFAILINAESNEISKISNQFWSQAKDLAQTLNQQKG